MMRGLGYGYDMMGGGWGAGVLMFFFGLIVIVGIVLIVVWALRGSGHHAGAGPVAPGAAAHDEAVAIAKRRFASGEIDKTQYDEIMRGLSG